MSGKGKFWSQGSVKAVDATSDGQGDYGAQESIDLRKELIDFSNVDPVLTRKMALVNAAIDEIGMTPFQWKLFFLNGFGYAADSVSAAHALNIDSV